MKILIILILLISNNLFAAEKKTVILLHGLGRTSNSMSEIERKLKKEGYDVQQFRYKSTKKDIDIIVQELDQRIKMLELNGYKINFVTHSFGGIIVRYYIQKYEPLNIGRIVMLAPPNHGSEIASIMSNSKIGRFFLGPNTKLLAKESDFLETLTKLETYDIGVIAGTKTLNPLFSFFIDGENDGKVSVDSAKMEGIKDLYCIHKTHTFIMYSNKVIKKIILFLGNGKF